jgi:serine/threonine-protein kinase
MTIGDSLVGKRLREYQILSLVGKGGMAKVYKARHVLLDELRAIKLLRPELTDTAEFIARFRREAQILVRLKHRHLVSVFEFGVLGTDLLFMVMEYLEGETLRDRLRRLGWLPPGECLGVARQVADGLSAAHRQGIVHRDVSPDNMFLVREDRDRHDGPAESRQPLADDDDDESDPACEIVKVIDFGIAKRVFAVGEGKITDTMKFVGKAEYCSPEQIRVPRGGEEVDGRSDIYSLGVTLFELLTGSLPYSARNSQGFIVQHLTAAPRSIAEVNPLASVPPGIEDLVMRMLSKDREERPASMSELGLELTALSRGFPGGTASQVMA